MTDREYYIAARRLLVGCAALLAWSMSVLIATCWIWWG